MAPGTPSRTLPVAALLAAMLLWASSFIALKVAFRGYDPMVVIFGRMAVASACFAVFLPGFKNVWQGWRRDLKALTFMALCEPCLYFLFEAKALENTTASQAGMITSLLPLMVAVAAGLFLGERVGRQTWFGFALAVAGACCLSLVAEPRGTAPRPALGNFLEFLAMVCATGYTVTLRSLTARWPPFLLTGLQAMLGAVFYLPLLFLPSTRLPTTFDPTASFAVLYLGTAVTLGAYGCYNFGVSRLPATQATVFINLIPVFTIVLGWALLGEQLSIAQWAACTLVFAGVYLSRAQAPQSPALQEAR